MNTRIKTILVTSLTVTVLIFGLSFAQQALASYYCWDEPEGSRTTEGWNPVDTDCSSHCNCRYTDGACGSCNGIYYEYIWTWNAYNTQEDYTGWGFYPGSGTQEYCDTRVYIPWTIPYNTHNANYYQCNPEEIPGSVWLASVDQYYVSGYITISENRLWEQVGLADWLKLTDVTGEPYATRRIGADATQWTWD